MKDSLAKTSFDKGEACFVVLTLKDVANVNKILNDHDSFVGYLENLSNHKLSNDQVIINDLDINKVEVKIKCPNKISTIQLENNLKYFEKDQKFEVSVHELIDMPVNFTEHIKTLHSHLLLEHDDKIKELREKLNPKSSNQKNKFCNNNEFVKKKQVQQTYKEKIDELEEQRKEFNNTFDLIKESLNYYTKNNIKAREEIIRLEKLFQREENRFKAILPIYAHKSEIINSVTMNQVVILVGETGSGKTTQIIQYLHDAWSFSDRIIVCTQPRKMAAVSVAVRVAEEMGTNVGGLVGYQVGMDCKKSKDTSLLFTTDHMLLNECQTDEMFGKYSCIILDEAHERSLYTDILLGFIKQSLKARPDLKLIVTSATINPDVFVNFLKSFNPPVLQVSGRVFPVETFYETSENDDYLTNTVKKASLLHNYETLPGDVLVFLTSPAETELAVRMLSNEKLQNALILPLHEQLHVAQQREVLLPTKPGLRKIIFATNAAETSVTIPGIRHVIDPGLVKEAVFDSIKNMTSLVIGKTTQSSANQRKGRAGRTESGKCYRLYKKEEFEEMRKNSVPEILRVHLGHSMLKLMMLGVQEPEAFDFVEAPPFASIQAALQLLREIGAVDVNGITEIGKKLAVLNLEPRLGKFSLMCMEEELGYEGIVICALSFSGNQVFYRGISDEDKFISDLKKISFCDDYGDLITQLNAYKKWEEIPKDDRVKWCLENSINSKRIKGVSELVEEIIQSFRQQLGMTIEKRFSEEDNVNERLTKILFKCFLNNLSRYTGHPKMGFRVMRDPEMAVHIHKLSALTYLGQMPVWVVFQSLLTTSQKYMLNVSYIKDEWITEAMDCGELLFSQKDIDAVALEMRQLPSIGSRIQKMLVLKSSCKNKLAIEAKICSKDKRICAFLELNSVPHLFLFASTLFINESFKIALQEINLMKEILSKEVLIKPISPTSEIRFVMIQGMRIIALLMNNEFLEVEIENCPRVLSYLNRFEGMLEFVKFVDNENKWILTFNDPAHAEMFLMYGGKARKDNETVLRNKIYSYSVIVKMIRRPAKETFIEFYDESDQNTLLFEDSLRLGTNILPMKVKSINSNVVIFQTPEWATDELILNAIKSEFHKKIKNVHLVYSPPPDKIENERQKESFSQCLTSYLEKDSTSYKITFKEPRHEDFTLAALITFDNSEEAQRIEANINDSSNRCLSASLDLKLTFYTPPNIYYALKNEVDEKCNGLQNLLPGVIRNVREPTKQNRDFVTMIETKTFLDYDLVKEEMSPFLSGLPWKTEFFETLQHLEEIAHISNINSTCIKFDESHKCLNIFGSRQNIELTKIQLKQAIQSKQKYPSRCVSLKSPEYPKGLMKQIILKYGCDIEKGLKETCKAESVRLVFKNHVIKIEGSDEAYDKLIQILNDVAVQLVRENVKIEPNIIGECPICLSDVQRDNHFVSESCGHIYCNSCAKQLIQSNIDQFIIPMICVIEICKRPFMIHDVQSLVSSNSEFEKLQKVALKCLQSKNPDRYKFCPTPDCSNVFPIKHHDNEKIKEIMKINFNKNVKGDSCWKELICSECGLNLCQFCGSQNHSSMYCPCTGILSVEEKRDLNSWMGKDTLNRGICPKCKSGIEKIGGCDHIVCGSCKASIDFASSPRTLF